MRTLIPTVALMLLAAMSGFALPGHAQENAVRLRGTVTSLSGNVLTVSAASGPAAVTLADNVQIAALAKGVLADIKPGAFIGAGARPQADGTLQAVQVVVFPESLRGAGEGHRAWGVMPEATMTNATVAEAVTGVAGPLVTLKYPQGEQKLSITDAATILALSPAAKTELHEGTIVQFAAAKAADGTLSAARITILRDGVNPL